MNSVGTCKTSNNKRIVSDISHSEKDGHIVQNSAKRLRKSCIDDNIPIHLKKLVQLLDSIPVAQSATEFLDVDADIPVESIIARFASDTFSMRKHQEDGIKFMVNVLLGNISDTSHRKDRFVFLGDEMGLGKTVQILAACLVIHTLQKRYKTPLHRGVFLIIVPRVIIPNFMNNARDFLGIPKARFVDYTGPSRHKKLEDALDMIRHAWTSNHPTFVICNPEIVRSDGEHSPLFSLPLTLVILDEAHKIKNFNTKTNKTIRKFRSMPASTDSCAQRGTKAFIFSTATFICNGIEDILGYVAVYGGISKMNIVSQWLKTSSHKAIQEYFGKHMVRRTVSVLADALPERKELLIPVIPSPVESSLIDMLSDAATNIWSVNESIKKSSEISHQEKSRMAAMVLVNILRLRQGCIAPELVSGAENAGTKTSDKAIYKCCIKCFDIGSSSNNLIKQQCGHMLCESCRKTLQIHFAQFSNLALFKETCGVCSLLRHYVQASGGVTGTSTKFFYALRILQTMLYSDPDKKSGVLVFSEFRSSLEMFMKICTKAGIPAMFLHGGMTSAAKNEIVSSYQDDECPIRVMMLTMGTGGVGLNLQRANRMIILDPAWDPKKEEQAIGRIYRIGQKREVRVVRLSYVNAVEDAMRSLQAKKHEEAKIVNLSVQYGGKTTDDTIEADFYDESLLDLDPIEKFMSALRDIVKENYKKRQDAGNKQTEILHDMTRNIESKMGVREGWLNPKWSFLL